MKDFLKFLADYIVTEIDRTNCISFDVADIRQWLTDGLDTYQDQNNIKCNLAAAPAYQKALQFIADMPCLSMLLGECGPEDDPCTCAACVAQAAIASAEIDPN